MADGVNISRGNPRASSVGEEEDVEEVRHRSTHALDPDLVTDIILCGEDNPCGDLDLSIYNVMGQEDKYREEAGDRVDRGGLARIILTTRDKVVIDKIEYQVFGDKETDAKPSDLTQEWSPSVSPERYHEVFVSVNPDALYAFRVKISVDGCPDTNISDIYYFETGDTIVLDINPNPQADPSIQIFSTVVTHLQDGLLGPISFETITPIASLDKELNPQTAVISSVPSHLQEASSISTSYTIT